MNSCTKYMIEYHNCYRSLSPILDNVHSKQASKRVQEVNTVRREMVLLWVVAWWSLWEVEWTTAKGCGGRVVTTLEVILDKPFKTRKLYTRREKKKIYLELAIKKSQISLTKEDRLYLWISSTPFRTSTRQPENNIDKALLYIHQYSLSI